MSTRERYLGDVIAAISAIDEEAAIGDRSYWITVSEISERAGVSRPTARKYVEELKDAGHVARAGTKRMPIYAVVKGL